MNTSTPQDDQIEWSQCSVWTAGSKVGIFLGFLQNQLQQDNGWLKLYIVCRVLMV